MRKQKVLARVVTCTLSMMLILSSFSSMALAQTSLSRISGTVMDSSGAVVPNADVVVKNNETGAEYKTKSGDDGSFVVPGLPVGVYTVTATSSGFKSTAVTDVKTVV